MENKILKITTPSYLVDILSRYFVGDRLDEIITEVMFVLSHMSMRLFKDSNYEITINEKMNLLFYYVGEELFKMGQSDISVIVEFMDHTVKELMAEFLLHDLHQFDINSVMSKGFYTKIILYEYSIRQGDSYDFPN